MTALDCCAAHPAADSTERNSLFERFLNAIYESRMRKARREINRHIHLVPKDILRQAGYRVSHENDGELPFTR